MSADKNTTPETTFLPPDGLERRFLGLAHPPPLLFRPFWSTFGQNSWKIMKTMVFHGFHGFSCIFMVFMGFQGFHGFVLVKSASEWY